MIRVVTSQLGFTRAFSIRVLIVRNVVPTVIWEKWAKNGWKWIWTKTLMEKALVKPY